MTSGWSSRISAVNSDCTGRHWRHPGRWGLQDRRTWWLGWMSWNRSVGSVGSGVVLITMVLHVLVTSLSKDFARCWLHSATWWTMPSDSPRQVLRAVPWLRRESQASSIWALAAIYCDFPLLAQAITLAREGPRLRAKRWRGKRWWWWWRWQKWWRQRCELAIEPLPTLLSAWSTRGKLCPFSCACFCDFALPLLTFFRHIITDGWFVTWSFHLRILL